jgi:hypothetical protein
MNAKGAAMKQRRETGYSRASGQKSSKCAGFSTGKIIPREIRHGYATFGTERPRPQFSLKTNRRNIPMYIGLGGLLVLILILWLLGVI